MSELDWVAKWAVESVLGQVVVLEKELGLGWVEEWEMVLVHQWAVVVALAEGCLDYLQQL